MTPTTESGRVASSGEVERRMPAIRFSRDGDQEILVAAGEHYETPRLPGFVLPLGDLLAIADRWQRS